MVGCRPKQRRHNLTAEDIIILHDLWPSISRQGRPRDRRQRHHAGVRQIPPGLDKFGGKIQPLMVSRRAGVALD
jgi:hypothetical protein